MNPATDRPLSLEDGDWITPQLRALGGGLAERSFANLYLFRDVHAYRVRDDRSAVLGVTYDGAPHLTFLQSAGPDRPLRSNDRGRVLYPMTAAEARPFLDRGWIGSAVDADSDYVFSTDDLAELRGARRKSRRQQARAFERLAAPHVAPLGPANADDAVRILNSWQAEVDRPWAATDYLPCREAIDLRGALDLFGLVVYADDGAPAGFLLASRLPDGSAAIHFAKGARCWPGVFPWMFSHFATSVRDSIPRLNFEQDLGNPGFRRAKRAYAPLARLAKVRLTQGPAWTGAA